jgi:hypothetical protein
MRATQNLMLAISIAAGSTMMMIAGCEDGPEQIFEPNQGDPNQQNGFTPVAPYTPEDPTKGFDDIIDDDNVARAKFCSEQEHTDLIQEMVTAPIIPDVGAGLISMWGADGGPLHADTLLGERADGKFCEPDGIYLDAYTWGPTQEVIVFFNQETHLVEGVIAYQQYLGALEGTYTTNGEQVPIKIQPRERILIGERELDQYSSRNDQGDKPNSWLNNRNVTAVYRMLRETFFGAEPFDENFDCVAAKLCDLIYTTGNESAPQDTFIVIEDSGIQIRFSPQGQAYFVYLYPIRVAPFETEGTIAFGPTGSQEMDFAFTSTKRATCSLSLDERLTYAQFQDRCIDAGDTRTEARAGYDVYTQRDAVQQSFNGIDLGWLRKTSEREVFHDGEHPSGSDELFSIAFSRSLEAPVDEFRARTLANLFKPRIEARVRNAIIASNSLVPPGAHPFESFEVTVPLMSDNPQRIGEIVTTFGSISFIPEVTRQVVELYNDLTPVEREMVDPRIVEEYFIVEPFVDAVLSAFSHGECDSAGAFKYFQTTADRRWSIGDAHFIRNDVPYRLQVQYSLNFGAVTYVSVERGFSEVDEIFHTLRSTLGGTEPFYSLDLALQVTNPYGLGGTAITVNGFDRQLTTLDVTLQTLLPGGMAGTIDLTVPGDPIEDRNGYLKQIHGERWEWVPADVVRLFGKETVQRFYVEADGAIGRVDQVNLTGAIELCPGLSIRFGDDVPAKVQAWTEENGSRAYTDCDLAFNYSPNGNVLYSVVSIANRRMVEVANGGAVSAAVWR